jgi:hypothetical protein
MQVPWSDNIKSLGRCRCRCRCRWEEDIMGVGVIGCGVYRMQVVHVLWNYVSTVMNLLVPCKKGIS